MTLRLFAPPKLTGKYLTDVLASGWLTTGPMNDRLRVALSEFFGVDSMAIVVCSSATAGFQAILDLLQPSFIRIDTATWPGMHHVISRTNYVPGGPNVEVETDIGGRRLLSPPDPRFPAKWVIRDACHSWMDEKERSFVLMSFYPTKLVPGAEGGVIICSPAHAEHLRAWVHCGLVPGTGGWQKPKLLGRKANMTDVQAALNLEALELAPAYMKEIEISWHLLAGYCQHHGIPYRDQPIRPYLFQLEVDPNDYRDLLEERLASWNFPPAKLLTIPCIPGLGSREIEAYFERIKPRALK